MINIGKKGEREMSLQKLLDWLRCQGMEEGRATLVVESIETFFSDCVLKVLSGQIQMGFSAKQFDVPDCFIWLHLF